MDNKANDDQWKAVEGMQAAAAERRKERSDWMPRGPETAKPMQMQRHNSGPFTDVADIADKVGAHA